MEAFSLQKVVEMLKEVIVSWQEVRLIWWMRQNFIDQSTQLLKHWLGDVWSGIFVEKNWAHPVDQCQLQALLFLCASHRFAEHILRRNGFTRIQKTSGSDQQQTIKQWPWTFLGASLALGSALELLVRPATELVITGCPLGSTFHCMSQSDWKMVRCCYIRIRKDNTSKWGGFLTCSHLMKHPLIELFHLSNLFQIPNNHRMVDVEFLGNFLYSFKRISFNNPLSWSLSAFNGQPLSFSSSRLLSTWQKFLNHHCTICSFTVLGPNALLMLRAVSADLWLILNLNKKPFKFDFCLTSFP